MLVKIGFKEIEVGYIEIAAEDHQIGPQSVERVDQRPHLAVGVDERPDVQVGELCDAQPVERLRQPVAAERDAVYGQRAAARHGTVNQYARHTERGDRCEDARRAALAERAHGVVGHARQREEQIGEKNPHGCRHHAAGVVLHQPEEDDPGKRQQIARRDERQEQVPVAVRFAVAAEIPTVGGERQQNQEKRHPHHS